MNSTVDNEGRKLMFVLNPCSKTSISYQLEKQIIDYVSLGILNANDQLSSVHSLADEFGINPYIVLKAYQKLESKGYIYMVEKEWYVSELVENKDFKGDKSSKFMQLALECRELGIEKIRLLSNTERIYEGGAKYAED